MHQLLGEPSIRALKRIGILTPVKAFDLAFHAPVTWDDELRLEVRVSSIGQHSFSFDVQSYLEDDTLAFTASITYVTVSPETKTKIPVPENLVSTLNASSSITSCKTTGSKTGDALN